MPDTGKKILIIDGHSILNRAFYGLPDLTNYEGLHTNAVLGFLNIIFKIIDEENPTNVCVAFDVKQPTFRHLMYKEYKGTRKPMPDELREQVPLIKEVLTAMNVTIVEKGGYEADDIIGTLSRVADSAGYKVVIVSGDRDLLQLATDNILVRIPKTKAGGTTIENYYADDVKDLYGVTPVQFIDMKGLTGDTSDNIPGVPGIGEKTASKIIQQWGSVAGALEHIDEIKPPKAQKNLAEFSEQAIMSRELAAIKLDCELDFKLEDTTYENAFNDNSYNIFKRLEFKSLLKKFDNQQTVSELKPDITVVNSTADFAHIEDAAKKSGAVGVYVAHSDDMMLGIAVACDSKDVYVINCSSGIDPDEAVKFIYDLKNAGIIICMEDLKSALKYVDFHECDTNVLDIGVAAYLLNPMEDSYDYDDVAKEYLGNILPSEKELIGKDELNIFTFISDNFLEVFSYKAVVPLLAKDIVMDKLAKEGMLELYNKVELPTVYTLYDMEKRGIRVDKAELEEYSKKLEKRIQELHDSIIGYAGKEFNINSPKQLGPILFEDMGIPGGKKTKTGYSTAADVLEKLAPDHKLVADILEYRQLAKLKSTYADGLQAVIGKDGRIHSTFNQTITATGRISSTDPNLQNIPVRMELGRLIRKAFVPKPGCVFLDADYSQIELRVLAHMSGDENLIEAYREAEDIHRMTASKVFHVPLEEVTPLQRRNAKAVNFGIVYGISSFGLGQDLGISRKEAEAYIQQYFETYPGIHEFLNRCVEDAKEKGYSVTMFGRRRPMPELKSSNFMQRSFGERVAMNAPIQGTAADIIKIAMIRVAKRLKEEQLKTRLLLQVHDELLLEVPEDELEKAEQILEEEMTGAAHLAVKLEIDMHTGNNWYEAK